MPGRTVQGWPVYETHGSGIPKRDIALMPSGLLAYAKIFPKIHYPLYPNTIGF
jgi:hypothetical protein